jgi:hypothetical protein
MIGVVELVILLIAGLVCLGVPILVGALLYLLVWRESSRPSAETQFDTNPTEPSAKLDR